MFSCNIIFKSLGMENPFYAANPTIHAHTKRVYTEVDGIKEYVASDAWKAIPFASPMVPWLKNDLSLD